MTYIGHRSVTNRCCRLHSSPLAEPTSSFLTGHLVHVSGDPDSYQWDTYGQKLPWAHSPGERAIRWVVYSLWNTSGVSMTYKYCPPCRNKGWWLKKFPQKISASEIGYYHHLAFCWSFHHDKNFSSFTTGLTGGYKSQLEPICTGASMVLILVQYQSLDQ